MAQAPDEKTYVEIPFIEQLKGMGWDHIKGDIIIPFLTERESFRDVLLSGRLRKAIKKINLDDEGNPGLMMTGRMRWPQVRANQRAETVGGQ